MKKDELLKVLRKKAIEKFAELLKIERQMKIDEKKSFLNPELIKKHTKTVKEWNKAHNKFLDTLMNK